MAHRARWSLLVLLALAAAASAGQTKRATADGSGKQAAFERFKQLAGEWVGKGEGPGMHVTYRVTSGGTAVIETDAPGTEQEMVTIIHPDGDDLILTHYCMLGNQPQMKAPGTPDGNKVS